MIIVEPIKGTQLVKAYSDLGYYLLQEDTGKLYASAVDMRDHLHVYVETDQKINEGADFPIVPPHVPEEDEPERYSLVEELKTLQSNFSSLQNDNEVLLECVLELSEIVYS